MSQNEADINPQPETIPQFATRLRTKYAAYDEVPDGELVDRYLRKNPVYTDRVQLPEDFKLLRSTSGDSKLDSLYEQAGRENNLDPNLLLEQGRVESVNFNPKWIYQKPNSLGYGGIAQLGKEEAATYGAGLDPQTGKDGRFDPAKAIPAQAKMMRHLLDRHNGNTEAALASYVAGSNYSTADALQARQRNGQARSYVDKITRAVKSLPVQLGEDFTPQVKAETANIGAAEPEQPLPSQPFVAPVENTRARRQQIRAVKPSGSVQDGTVRDAQGNVIAVNAGRGRTPVRAEVEPQVAASIAQTTPQPGAQAPIVPQQPVTTPVSAPLQGATVRPMRRRAGVPSAIDEADLKANAAQIPTQPAYGSRMAEVAPQLPTAQFTKSTGENRSGLENMEEGARAIAGLPNDLPGADSLSAGKSLRVELQSDKQPTQDQLSDAAVKAMGAAGVNEKYRQETRGRNIVTPNLSAEDLQYDPQTKTYSFMLDPIKQDYDVVNAYAKGGLAAAQTVATNARAEQQKAIAEMRRERDFALKTLHDTFGVKPEDVSETNGAAAKGLADTALGLTHLLNNVSSNFRDPASVRNITRQAEETQGQIPEEKSFGGRAVRGVTGLVSSLPEYGLLGSTPGGAAVIAYMQNRHKGTGEAIKAALEIYAAGKVLHSVGGRTAEWNPIARQIAARGAAGTAGMAMSVIGGERDPVKIIEQGLPMAAMPIGKGRRGEAVSPRPLAEAPQTSSMVAENEGTLNDPEVQAGIRNAREAVAQDVQGMNRPGLSTVADQMRAQGKEPLSPEMVAPAPELTSKPVSAPETPHYSSSQNRRVRNTKYGDKGEFIGGFKAENVSSARDSVPTTEEGQTAEVVSPPDRAQSPQGVAIQAPLRPDVAEGLSDRVTPQGQGKAVGVSPRPVERATPEAATEQGTPERLPMPETVLLSPSEFTQYEKNAERLKAEGYEIFPLTGRNVAIQARPAGQQGNVVSVFRGRLRQSENVPEPASSRVAAPAEAVGVKQPFEMARDEFDENYQRVGLPEPPRRSKYPDVDFEARDLQDSGKRVTEDSIRKDYADNRPDVDVYESYIPIEDLPSAKLAEAEDPESGGYDWSELRGRARSVPPIKVRVDAEGKLHILDGNHRLEYWEQSGQEYIPAWVIDEDGHRSAIVQAAKEGKQVPANVLAEYPDLAQKYQGRTQEATATLPATKENAVAPEKSDRPEVKYDQVETAKNGFGLRRRHILFTPKVGEPTYHTRHELFQTDTGKATGDEFDAQEEGRRVLRKVAPAPSVEQPKQEQTAPQTEPPPEISDLTSRLKEEIGRRTAKPTEPSPEVAPEAPQPSARRARASVKAEKVSARTGLTPTQTNYLAGELEKVADRHIEENTGINEAGGTLTADEFKRRFIRDSESPIPADFFREPMKEPATIKVPGDGEFTVRSAREATRLHQKITGQPIEGFEKATKATVPRAGTSQTYRAPDRGRDQYADWAISAYGDVRTAAKKMLAMYKDVQNHPEKGGYSEDEVSDLGDVVTELQSRARKDIRVGDRIEFEDGKGETVQRTVKDVLKRGDYVMGYHVDEPYDTNLIQGRGRKKQGRATSDFISQERAEGIDEAQPLPRLTNEERTDYEQAKANIKSKLSSSSLKSSDPYGLGLFADLAPDLIKVGKYHALNGYREFKAWSEKMIGELGEGIKPYLANLWAHVQDEPKTEPERVEAFGESYVKQSNSLIEKPEVKQILGDIENGKSSIRSENRLRAIVKDAGLDPTHADEIINEARGVQQEQVSTGTRPGAESSNRPKESAEPTRSGRRTTEPTAERAPAESTGAEPSTVRGAGAGDTRSLQPEDVTGARVAITRQERAESGLNPVEMQAYKSVGDAYYTGKAQVEKGTLDPRRLAEEVAGNPRPLNADEVGALAFDRARLKLEQRSISKDISDAVDKGDEEQIKQGQAKLEANARDFDLNTQALEKGGREQSAAFNARKAIVRDDYSVNEMIQSYKAETGREPSPRVRAQIEEQSRRILELEKQIAQHEEQGKRSDAQDGLDRIKDEVAREGRKSRRASTRADLDIEFAQLSTQFSKHLETKLHANPLDPELVKIIGKMAKNRVLAGVNTIEGLVDAVHAQVKDYLDDKRAIRDVISGYGKEKQSRQVEEWQKTLNDLKSQMRDLSKQEDEASGIREKASVKAQKTRLQNSINEYERRIREGDFTPPTRRQIEHDRQSLDLLTQVGRVKEQYENLKQQEIRRQRPLQQKILDAAVKGRRAVALSSSWTLGKLTSAATQRLGITPIEEIEGGFMSVLPGLKTIARQAPSEGGFRPSAESQAIARAWRTYLEAFKPEGEIRQALKTGKTSIDVLYGGKRELPPEALDFIGHLHSALKAPAKLAQWERSMSKNLDWLRKQGKDISDPAVRQWAGARAYVDANRAVLMQDNMLSDGFSQMLSYLNNKGALGRVTAAAGRLIFPVTKVAPNFVKETLNYAMGSVNAMTRMAAATKFFGGEGLKNLTPDQADGIMRAFKKQGLGVALFALGVLNRGSIGGYGSRKDDKDVQAGGMRIFGWDVPSWLLHTPPLEVMQMGATYGRTLDAKGTKPEEAGFAAATLKTSVGLAREIPFFEEPMQAASHLDNYKSASTFAGSMAGSMITPPDVARAAKAFDPNEPTTTGKKIAQMAGVSPMDAVRRRPQNFGQAAEMGWPGARQNVPVNNLFGTARTPSAVEAQRLNLNVGDSKQGENESVETFQKRQTEVNPLVVSALDSLLRERRYGQLSDDEKKKVFSDVVRRVRENDSAQRTAGEPLMNRGKLNRDAPIDIIDDAFKALAERRAKVPQIVPFSRSLVNRSTQ